MRNAWTDPSERAPLPSANAPQPCLRCAQPCISCLHCCLQWIKLLSSKCYPIKGWALLALNKIDVLDTKWAATFKRVILTRCACLSALCYIPLGTKSPAPWLSYAMQGLFVVSRAKPVEPLKKKKKRMVFCVHWGPPLQEYWGQQLGCSWYRAGV